jgi:hypothetical protein
MDNCFREKEIEKDIKINLENENESFINNNDFYEEEEEEIEF